MRSIVRSSKALQRAALCVVGLLTTSGPALAQEALEITTRSGMRLQIVILPTSEDEADQDSDRAAQSGQRGLRNFSALAPNDPHARAAAAAAGATGLLAGPSAPIVIQLDNANRFVRSSSSPGAARERTAVGASISNTLRQGDGLAVMVARSPENHPALNAAESARTSISPTSGLSESTRSNSVDVAAAYAAPVAPNLDLSLGVRLRLDPDRRANEQPNAEGQFGVRLRF